MSKPRIATTWLEGCSGCHMSFLDMDERLIDLTDSIEYVFGPYIDIKEFPENVDITLVEGAAATVGDLRTLHEIREKSGKVIAFGDCAVTGNVPAMRNQFKVEEVFDRAYHETATENPLNPSEEVPRLLATARPIHEIIPVDLHIPGCPPSADTIFYALTELLAGRIPDINEKTRFGK